MTPRRLAAIALSIVALLLTGFVAAAPAQAAPDVNAAAAALRGGASVYSDPAAELALTDSQVDDLTSRIGALDVPVFVAVLPAAAAGGADVDQTLTALHDAVGLNGVYAIAVGKQFRAGATSNNALAAQLATKAFRAERDNGLYAVLGEFVTLVAASSGSPSTAPADSGGSSLVGTVILFAILVAVAVVVFFVVRAARRRSAAQLGSVRATIDSDVTTYGEQLARLNIDDPDLDEAGRAELQQAFDSYDRAKSAVAVMRRPADAGAVTTALADGRYSLACAQARMDGQPLPERRPPCFVDPRHGPSVDDVSWTPPGLTQRDVPLCAACATTVRSGGQPAGLEVATPGGQRPYYQAGPEYGSYAGGYFGSFAPVMSAVLVGTMMSSMWHAPTASAASDTSAAGLGGGWDGGGGWGGGGDFGGGGGDFGGGDF